VYCLTPSTGFAGWALGSRSLRFLPKRYGPCSGGAKNGRHELRLAGMRVTNVVAVACDAQSEMLYNPTASSVRRLRWPNARNFTSYDDGWETAIANDGKHAMNARENSWCPFTELWKCRRVTDDLCCKHRYLREVTRRKSTKVDAIDIAPSGSTKYVGIRGRNSPIHVGFVQVQQRNAPQDGPRGKHWS
jgi:hypothetical protein